MISSLLHLVGLRPRVYYTLTDFRGAGARPPCPPPSIRQCNDIQISDSFKVTNGVRQGGILSPQLFNIYIDGLSDILNKSSVGGSIGGPYALC